MSNLQNCRGMLLEYATMSKERGQLKNDALGVMLRGEGVVGVGPLLDRVCVTCTGSDGRLEKGHISKPEIIIYSRGMPRCFGSCMTMAIRSVQDVKGEKIVDPSPIDVKDVTSSSMAFVYEEQSRPYPSRVFDSYYLCGNPDVLVQAKLRLIQELATDVGRSISDRIADRVRYAKGTVGTGIQKWKGTEVRHYDLEAGTAFYGDIVNGAGETLQIRSFKPGPVRLIQTALERALVQILRTAVKDGNDALGIIKDMTTPTIEKLEHLYNQGLIKMTKSEVDDLIDIYIAFLQLYHTSERLAKSGHGEISFDAKEAKERIAALLKILEKGIRVETG